MDKKGGMLLLIFLVLLLGTVNAAWIISYKKTITTNVIGEKSVYNISWEFDNTLSLNTNNGPASTDTSMKIDGLTEDMNMTFEIETRRTNLSSEEECPNYEKDCDVIVTHIYDDGIIEIKTILSDSPTTIGDEANFTLFAGFDNFIEYKIECVEDSCPQRINSNVTLKQI